MSADEKIERTSWSAGIVKLLASLALASIAFWYVASHSSSMRESASQQKNNLAQVDLTNQDKAIEAMKATNDLLINWATLTLGSTLGIAILGKGVKIRDGRMGMIPFPAVRILLLAGSLENGSLFKRSLTFQYVTSKYSFPDLNLYLYLQLDFLKTSFYVLALVALYYLFCGFANLGYDGKGSKEE